jgi:hypothetical protein
VLALRYVYVLALTVWFGGIVIIGLVAHPVSDPVLHRLFIVSCVSAALLLSSLLAMGLLGPRPSGFAARFGVAVVMLAATLYRGAWITSWSRTTLAVTVMCGLALLFWEARDGTRAA